MSKRRHGSQRTRFWMYLVAILLGSAFLGGARPTGSPPPPATEIVPVGAKTTVPADPMQTALKVLAISQSRFASVKDYTCTMIKRERVRGKLLPPQVIDFRARNNPYSVYMKWNAPSDLNGQQACYVEGKNKGKMRVKPVGVLGAFGFVTLDVNDPRTRKHSNHSIVESGLANLLTRCDTGWKQQAKLKKIKVKIGEYTFNNRRVVRVETIHLAKIPGIQDNYRNVIYFDRQTWFPVRVERYNWPKQVGDSKGELQAEYSYLNIKTNVNLPDSTFSH